jgi:predicted transposase/invertase (TIGR01784 family)
MFDNICKFLAETYSEDFAKWLLGESISFQQLSPSELSLEPIRADSLIILESSNIILHLEFQTQPDSTIPFRMIDYCVRIYRRYPEKRLHQVVIYLKPTTSELVYQNSFTISQTRHEFKVIRLWEVKSTELLEYEGLLPLAVLGKTEDTRATLSQVAREIDKITDRRERSNVAASTQILAGLVLEKELIRKILREEIMKESVIYQDIIAEGIAKGEAQGIVKGEASLILRLLNRKLGNIPENISQKIQQLPLEQLDNLGEALLDFNTQSDLANWLELNV